MDFAAFGQQLVLDVHNKITGKDRKFRGCQDVLGLRGSTRRLSTSATAA
jgi:hypothetical protein